MDKRTYLLQIDHLKDYFVKIKTIGLIYPKSKPQRPIVQLNLLNNIEVTLFIKYTYQFFSQCYLNCPSTIFENRNYNLSLTIILFCKWTVYNVSYLARKKKTENKFDPQQSSSSNSLKFAKGGIRPTLAYLSIWPC